MANAKRASMREGPLAALFRKTEGIEEPAAEPVEKTTAPEQPKSRKAPPAEQRAQEPRGDERGRERQLPHPALGAAPEEPSRPAHVPTPQERLRHAFSSEIP